MVVPSPDPSVVKSSDSTSLEKSAVAGSTRVESLSGNDGTDVVPSFVAADDCACTTLTNANAHIKPTIYIERRFLCFTRPSLSYLLSYTHTFVSTSEGYFYGTKAVAQDEFVHSARSHLLVSLIKCLLSHPVNTQVA